MGEKIAGRSGGKLRRTLREAGPIIGAKRKEKRKAREKAEVVEGKIAKQEQKAKNKLANEASEVALRKLSGAAALKTGRRSLIATSQTGLSSTLGGGKNG